MPYMIGWAFQDVMLGFGYAAAIVAACLSIDSILAAVAWKVRDRGAMDPMCRHRSGSLPGSCG